MAIYQSNYTDFEALNADWRNYSTMSRVQIVGRLRACNFPLDHIAHLVDYIFLQIAFAAISIPLIIILCGGISGVMVSMIINIKSGAIIWSCSASVAAVAAIVLGITYYKLSREKFSPRELQQLHGIIQNALTAQIQNISQTNTSNQQRLSEWAQLNWSLPQSQLAI